MGCWFGFRRATRRGCRATVRFFCFLFRTMYDISVAEFSPRFCSSRSDPSHDSVFEEAVSEVAALWPLVETPLSKQ